MFCRVSPFSKTFDEIWLIYYVPDFLVSEISAWKLVEIPLREEIELAVVLEIDVEIWNTPEEKIKSLIWSAHENVFLEKYQIELIDFIAKNYYTPIHNAVSLFFPKNLLEKIKKQKFLNFETKNNYNYKSNYEIIFSQKQKNIVDSISQDEKYLLYWITWSGKTEIYIELIRKQLQKGKQSLLLIPEIILSNQISDKIKQAFWDDVIIINSTVSQAVRTQYFCDIKSWKAKIIVGTRSALFYPYSCLWLVIMDEEHDNSFSSDQSPRFHSKELLNFMNKSLNFTLLLASWTPSVSSMFHAMKWEYKLLNLLEKYKKPE